MVQVKCFTLDFFTCAESYAKKEKPGRGLIRIESLNDFASHFSMLNTANNHSLKGFSVMMFAECAKNV